MNRKISVIITCFSEGFLLREAVKSVLEQSNPNWEIIVVNDASPNVDTISACNIIASNPKIQVINRSMNGGTSAARNDGFQAATGDICVLLDADDCLPKDALAIIQNTFEQHPEAEFAYGDYFRQDQPNLPQKIVRPSEISLSNQLSARPFSLSSNWTLLGTSPIRRSLWQKVGGYDLEFGIEDLHDVEFWIRVIASGCDYVYIPQPIYTWRKFHGSNSGQVTPLAWAKVAKKHLDIYCQTGLEFRAYELLLLGSKWLNHNPREIQRYSKKLWKYLLHGNIQFSTLITLGMPAYLLRLLAGRARKKR
ncbi:glycosyltransferase [Acaryochloris sp. 'Moss Beach']|uniref:glycosyltransferase family 2 protein n=1 Tax=Acaryochloris sp. 'Moss Beach' TaxID=2740837 RepID=UPI001F2C5BA9|nr:glycosyltransferase [Acaryochloris sp. 'Moss Beach']UJB69475.1 glycosyltransferase [Acaryochloris sp. 'Moss Beach']